MKRILFFAIKEITVLLNTPGLFEYIPEQNPTKDQLSKAKKLRPYEIIEEQLQNNKSHYYILSAGTSAGKSSFFMDRLLKFQDRPIICTQPRVQLCVEKMTDLPIYLKDLVPEQNIGYSVGNNVELKARNYKNITFMTTEKLQNKLLQAINNNEILEQKYIVIDEAHDISEQMIVTLLTIKQYTEQFSKQDKDFTFIFMSATIDIDLFTKYFDMKIDNYNIGYITRNAQQQYNKTITYIDKGSLEERFFKALDNIYSILNKEDTYPSKDTLIFCSSGQQIKYMMELYNKYAQSHSIKNFKTIPFQFTAQDQKQNSENNVLFNDNETHDIRFIFSTSLLQAGATIPTLKFVVDIGVQLSPCIFPLSNNINVLNIPISESNKIQRIGRVGRKSDGYDYLLYSQNLTLNKNDYNPFIISSSQQYNLLFKILRLQIKNYSYLSLVHNPPYLNYQQYQILFPISIDFLSKGIYILFSLNIIDKDSRLTPFGIYILQNNIPIILVIAILCNAQFLDLCLIQAIFGNNQIKSLQRDFLFNAFYNRSFESFSKIQANVLGEVFNNIAINQQDFHGTLYFNKGDNNIFDYKKFYKIVKYCQL